MREPDGDKSRHQDERTTTGNPEDSPALRLIRQAGRYLHLLNITRDAVICIDKRCRILVFNQGAERLFGYDTEDVIGRPLTRLICKHFREQQKHRLNALIRMARDSTRGFRIDRIDACRKNGRRFPAEISVAQTRIQGDPFYTLIVRDGTGHLEEARRLEHRAQHDDLTKLPNRILLNDRLAAGMARADRSHRRLGVVYLDLDNFKPINDRYGHDTGDCLLQAIARRLKDTMRQSDTVSRIGGDEFIVCLEYINDAKDAATAVAKIDQALKEPFQILGHQISTTASIGIALYPDHGHDPATLLKRADEAMYEAKDAGAGPRIYRPRAGG